MSEVSLLIPFFKKHRNEPQFTSLPKRGCLILRGINRFQTMIMKEKLFLDNNRDKNHQVRYGNVAHNL